VKGSELWNRIIISKKKKTFGTAL